MQTKYPELLKEWDYNKNNLAPSEVIAGGHTKYYWICEKGHSYENRVLKRASGVGCPICDGKVVLRDIMIYNPNIQNLLRNGILIKIKKLLIKYILVATKKLIGSVKRDIDGRQLYKVELLLVITVLIVLKN